MHSALSLAVIGALALGTDARAFGERQFGGFGGRHGFGGGFSGFGGGRYSEDGSTPTGSFPTGSFPTGSFGSPSGIASFGTGAPVATSAPEFSAVSSAPAQSFALPSSSVAVADVASSAQSSGYYGNATASYAASSAIITGGTAATTTFPEASGTSTLSEPMTVTGTFDGGMYSFGRGVSCNGQEEGGDSDAVFELEDGATLKNVIIGADQMEGVHCLGSCTIENVWWVAVCEDALTIKQTSGTSYVIGGGAQGAEDKVIQHNGGGTVSISGFYVSDFGKLYRSCGNCDEMYERHVIIENVIADSGSVLAGINSNYGDTATITNTCATDVETICEEFEGNNTGDEPTEISEGPSDYCKYTTSDVSVC